MSELVKSLNFGHRLTPDGYFDTARTDEIMFAAAERIAELEAQLKSAPFGDPYQGAREDLLMWKRDCEVLRQELDAYNGALILSARKCKELEAQLQSHSASAVVGPTPVTVAAPACEQPS